MRVKHIVFAGLLFLVAVYGPIAGVFSTTAGTEVEARRQQMRRELQATYEPIGIILEEILWKVNLNQRPDPALLGKAQELIEANKRSLIAYESPQKAGYMLLQAWVFYYQDNLLGALNWAMRACREEGANSDAWVTQSLFSYLAGRRPIESQVPRSQTETRRARPQRPQMERRPRPQLRGHNGVEVSPEPTIAESVAAGPLPAILDADLNALNKEFYRYRFNQKEYLAASGEEVTFTPGRDLLCILFWKTDASVTDFNHPDTLPPTQPMGPEMPVMPIPIETEYALGAASSLEDQQAYFAVAKEVLAVKKEIVFVEINADAPSTAEEAISNHTPVAPLVVGSQPNSGATEFVRMIPQTPFMAIVDSSGQVKYSGPAQGFMPAFILTHLTGAAFDLEPYLPESAAGMLDMGLTQSGMPADANLPAPPMPVPMGPEPMPPLPQRTQQAAPQYRDLPVEQEADAEKRMAYARDFFMKAPKLRIYSYKNGVDLCRGIIRDYPSTKYAEEARQLLRQVPERQQRLYNITNEELGL